MNHSKKSDTIKVIRVKTSVRIGVTEHISVPVDKLAPNIEVIRKGRDIFIYDKRLRQLTEIPSDNIAYIQYEPDTKQSSVETGEGSPSGSEEA